MKLEISNLLSLEEYDSERENLKKDVINHKKNRTVSVGDNIVLIFEDFKTIKYQVQEMLRIEKIFKKDEIQEEILSSLGKYPGRPIRMGSKSKKIPEIKEFLKLSGSDFDKEMENSIKLLQFSYGLPETGVIDKDTWNALTSEV